MPVTEMTDQGWDVGYSVAGEVVAVGEGITASSRPEIASPAPARDRRTMRISSR